MFLGLLVGCVLLATGAQARSKSSTSAEAIKAKYRELGLQVKTNNHRIWKLLSNVLQRPFQLDAALICRVVEHIEHSEGDVEGPLGSILIFVPGWSEINSVIKSLKQ